jgi:hypothetical protein
LDAEAAFAGGWINKKSKRPVLYHMREVVEAPIVFAVEGGKDVETPAGPGLRRDNARRRCAGALVAE